MAAESLPAIVFGPERRGDALRYGSLRDGHVVLDGFDVIELLQAVDDLVVGLFVLRRALHGGHRHVYEFAAAAVAYVSTVFFFSLL